jgi:hypothetical protein
MIDTPRSKMMIKTKAKNVIPTPAAIPACQGDDGDEEEIRKLVKDWRKDMSLSQKLKIAMKIITRTAIIPILFIFPRLYYTPFLNFCQDPNRNICQG